MATGKTDPQKRGGFRILYQILLAMLLIALIPLGGLYFISIYKSGQDWAINIEEKLSGTTKSLAQSVDDWTNLNLRTLEQNSQTPAIISMVADQQNPVLKSIQDSYSWIYLAFTIQPDGQNVGRSDGKETVFYGDRDYFKQVVAGKPTGIQVLMGKTSKKPALILAKAIKEGNRNNGVIAIAMTLEDLSQTITDARIGQTGFAILVDEQRRLIAHGKGGVSSELQDFSHHPVFSQLQLADRDSYIYEEDGRKIVAFTEKTEQGWTLIVQQDYQEAFAAAQASQQNALYLLIATVIAVILIALLLANRLSTPIQNLTNIADAISRGKLDAKIAETRRSDEIGALARAIERMGVSLSMAFDRLRKR